MRQWEGERLWKGDFDFFLRENADCAAGKTTGNGSYFLQNSKHIYGAVRNTE